MNGLLKRVRMPTSTAAPEGVVFLVGGEGGGVPRSIVSGRNLRFGGGYIDDDTHGSHSPRWRCCGGLLDRMMAMSLSSPRGGIIFGDIYRLDGQVDGFGYWTSVFACFLCGDQGGTVLLLLSLWWRVLAAWCNRS